MTDTELKNCPFCGHPASITEDSHHSRDTFYVGCDFCDCQIVIHHLSRQDAIAAWNRRAREAYRDGGEREALEEMKKSKDAAYEERNKVVAALAKMFPSGTARTAIEGWSDDWHGCVYIDLPTGQVSWHYHDSQAWLFDDLPPYQGKWDGHDTPEKYRRLAALGFFWFPERPSTGDGERVGEALEEIAKQRLPREMGKEDRADADFEDDYAACVMVARAALSLSPAAMDRDEQANKEYNDAVKALSLLTDDKVNKLYAEAQRRGSLKGHK